jgi:prepilin-type N-terminal cleavage/methylation domain-containing protein
MQSVKRASNKAGLKSSGFTIVELIIVIIVIGILTAIVTLSYAGISRRSVETSMQTDLRNAATVIEKDRQLAGAYPANGTLANSGSGLKSSVTNTLDYSITSTGYCITVVSTKLTGSMYHITNGTGEIKSGACPAAEATITTLAGSATHGLVNATGTAARFNLYDTVDDNWGGGLDIGPDGNIYVADTGNNLIRKITPSGVVTTFAGITGDGGEIITEYAATSSYNYPTDLAFGTYLGENIMGIVTQHCARVIWMDDIPNYDTSLINEGALGAHDGHMECAYATNGSTTSQYSASFQNPMGLVIDSNSNIYIREVANGKIRKLSFDTPTEWWTQVLNLTTLSSGNWGTWAGGLGVDASNRMYTVDGNKIVRFTTTGTKTDFAGSSTGGYVDGASTSARFDVPQGIDVDASGNVYVADCENHRIRKITASGTVSTIAGSGVNGGANGVGTSAQFYCPVDVAVASDGSVAYVLDMKDNGSGMAAMIRKLTF